MVEFRRSQHKIIETEHATCFTPFHHCLSFESEREAALHPRSSSSLFVLRRMEIVIDVTIQKSRGITRMGNSSEEGQKLLRQLILACHSLCNVHIFSGELMHELERIIIVLHSRIISGPSLMDLLNLPSHSILVVHRFTSYS